MKFNPVFALVLFVSGMPLASIAEDSASLYAVEVLVFKNLHSITENDEYLVDEDGNNSDTPNIENALIPQNMPKDNSELTAAAEKMQASGDYEILSHQRWLQNVDIKTETQPIRIATSKEITPSLDGAITFFISRFLHLDIDLALSDNASSFLSSDTVSNSYRIKDTRRIKTAEINFFDHPNFGVLVEVIQLKNP